MTQPVHLPECDTAPEAIRTVSRMLREALPTPKSGTVERSKELSAAEKICEYPFFLLPLRCEMQPAADGMAEKSVITNLGIRIRQLIADHRRLSGVCGELTAECRRLKSENRASQERIKELESELARMQLTAGLAGDGQNREKARARVNRLMREVDKCIALLDTPQES